MSVMVGAVVEGFSSGQWWGCVYISGVVFINTLGSYLIWLLFLYAFWWVFFFLNSLYHPPFLFFFVLIVEFLSLGLSSMVDKHSSTELHPLPSVLVSLMCVCGGGGIPILKKNFLKLGIMVLCRNCSNQESSRVLKFHIVSEPSLLMQPLILAGKQKRADL